MWFGQLPRLFQPSRLLTLEILTNLPVYCTLPVYYFGRNLPASSFIPPSPSIWHSRVLKDFLKLLSVLCLHSSNTITFLNGLHWAVKWELKSLNDILKSDTGLPSARVDGVTGIFFVQKPASNRRISFLICIGVI